MSVNIFCSSDKSIKNDNEYVDQKFITLSTNLNTKISKNGDAMTGSLNTEDNKITSRYIPVNENYLVNTKLVNV